MRPSDCTFAGETYSVPRLWPLVRALAAAGWRVSLTCMEACPPGRPGVGRAPRPVFVCLVVRTYAELYGEFRAAGPWLALRKAVCELVAPEENP